MPEQVLIPGDLYGASRTRTGDLLGAIQALFQLSYSPEDARVYAVAARGRRQRDSGEARGMSASRLLVGLPAAVAAFALAWLAAGAPAT